MDGIGKETGPSWMAIQDQEQWAQNVEGYKRGLPKPESMSEASPILIQLKRWCDNKWAKIQKHVDLAVLSTFKHCWAAVGWFCSSCGSEQLQQRWISGLITLPGHSWRRKRYEGHKGGVDGIYLAVDYTCLSDFLFAH
jgi:hypothetical protein